MKHDFTPQLQRELTPETSAAISQSIDNMSSYMSAANTSRKERKWQEKWYGIQRADRIADWERTNEYNSPAQQMARLKAAGLNPNLVYGNGADAQGGQINSPGIGSPNFPVPPTGNGTGIGAYLNTQMSMAQLENIKAQNALIHAQTNNLNSSTKNRDVDTEGKTFRNRFNLKNEQIDTEQKEANLQNTYTQKDKAINEIALSRNRDYREAILNASTVKEATARVAEIYARINNLMPAQIAEINARIAKMEKEGRLLEYEADLNSEGAQKNDSFIFRMISKIVASVVSGF